MNNLLRTLTESNAKPPADLRLLLTAVKEGRKQTYDAKLSDPFYDSLEGLLMDLRTVTIDNRDAEAFLKPVSKAEVPDYYDVIQNPMDFQTMLKKVKSKQYKSKREFQDDLELIWSNCLTYNAAETHPLRKCVKRLKLKADRLLKYITDRKERTDPMIPNEIPRPVARVKLNGHHLTNGYTNGASNSRSRTHTRSPSSPYSLPNGAFASSSSTDTTIPAVVVDALVDNNHHPSTSTLRTPFPDTPAIIRTPEGMAAFRELDRSLLQSAGHPPPLPEQALSTIDRLRRLAPPMKFEAEVVVDEETDEAQEDANAMLVDGAGAGEKRKSNNTRHERPSKRCRFTFNTTPTGSEHDELTQLWWGAVQGTGMIGNGLPEVGFASSAACAAAARSKTHKPKEKIKSKEKSTAPQKLRPSRHHVSQETPSPPKSLLTLMNTNIKTMKRLRHTHAKFAALAGANNTGAGGEDAEGEGAGPSTAAPGFGYRAGSAGPAAVIPSTLSGVNLEDEIVDDKIDEQPWMVGRRLMRGSNSTSLRKGKRSGKEKIETTVGGIEIGEGNATDCVRWANMKVLEHVGFQGTSNAALDVLTGLTSEYLLNVGRTIRYMCDKYSKTMTPEEIILHTLFESGTSKVQDLERYISDDVERYGTRLSELEKKLVGVYRDSTAAEIPEDEGLFEEEDEEETGALAMGDFADMLGEDYLGLRELGIADEFKMTNLSIPKKLLRSKKASNKPATAKPTEPLPPYPPPPPFIPLTSTKVGDQIGLLQPYYHDRFTALSAVLPPSAAPPPSLPGPSFVHPAPQATLSGPVMPSMYPPPNENPGPMQPPAESTPPTILTLPDDPPNPVQAKMGPLGQIVKTVPSAATKKKAKAPAAPDQHHRHMNQNGTNGAGPGIVYPVQGSGPGYAGDDANGIGAALKKKKGTTGVGTGNGRKKKMGGDHGYHNGPGQQSGSPAMLPPVVAASA